MKCPGCGVDVEEKSVYCHKCGERLDMTGNEGASPEAAPAVPEEMSSAPAPKRAVSPAERFREAVGAGGDAADLEEEELWEGGYCVKAMAGAWLVTILATIGLLAVAIWIWDNAIVWWSVLGAIALLWLYQAAVLLRRRLGVQYRLTSLRFFHETGVLVHTTDLIEVIDMDDITFRQTLIDRMTGVGTICIESSDRSHPMLWIHGIENVRDVAAKMHNARHAERMRRGLHIESI